MGYDADMDIGRGVVRRVEVLEVKDDGEFQTVTVQGLADEIFELSMRVQGHGMTSVPPVGSHGLAFLVTGRPDLSYLMGLEHPDHRPKQRQPGETTVYGQRGNRIDLKEDGSIRLTAADGGGIVDINAAGIVHINP